MKRQWRISAFSLVLAASVTMLSACNLNNRPTEPITDPSHTVSDTADQPTESTPPPSTTSVQNDKSEETVSPLDNQEAIRLFDTFLKMKDGYDSCAECNSFFNIIGLSDAMVAPERVTLSDGSSAYSVGVTFTDYKKAMLRYVSEEYFNDYFMECYEVTQQDQMVWIFGGKTGSNFEITDVQYQWEQDDVHQYLVSGKCWQMDENDKGDFVCRIDVIQRDGHSVVNSMQWH